MTTAHLLLHGARVAELQDVEPDMPWFQARFVASPEFEAVESLFREERVVSEQEDFDAEAWQALWERMWSEGVTLLLPDGTEVTRDFAVHVYNDGTARFRY